MDLKDGEIATKDTSALHMACEVNVPKAHALGDRFMFDENSSWDPEGLLMFGTLLASEKKIIHDKAARGEMGILKEVKGKPQDLPKLLRKSL